METLVLHARPRAEMKNKVKELRRMRTIPGVMYGHGMPSASIAFDAVEFGKVFKKAGMSNLIDLMLGESAEPVKVLIKEYQIHPLKNSFMHVDMYQVRMDEELEADVKLATAGEAPAVKELGGVLVKNVNTITIKCLPKDLVGELSVDITGLKEFGQAVHLKDIVVPPGVKLMGHPEDVLVTVAAPRSEEEINAASGAVVEDVAQVKVVAEEKKKTEEASAGEEAEK